MGPAPIVESEIIIVDKFYRICCRIKIFLTVNENNFSNIPYNAQSLSYERKIRD